jgi:hypothetical protein
VKKFLKKFLTFVDLCDITTLKDKESQRLKRLFSVQLPSSVAFGDSFLRGGSLIGWRLYLKEDD